MHTLVLVRHGESLWNKENRFTGWKDIDLSEKGQQEAHDAGILLREEGYIFDIAFTSVLKRAIRTLWCILDEMDLMWIPVNRSWRLNERHYGALTGLNKAETAAKYGDEQVHIWRRSYSIRPPAFEAEDLENPAYDPRYHSLTKKEIPLAECLHDNVNRSLPYWQDVIAPDILEGKKVLIVAHGNSIRALVKHLDAISDDDITGINIPTGIPLVYHLDTHLRPIQKQYLGDPDTVAAAINGVKNQGRKQ